MIENKSPIPFNGAYNPESGMLELYVYYLDKAEEAQEMWNLVEKSFEGKTTRKAIVDLSRYERTFIAKDVRRVFRDHMDFFKTVDRTAFVVTNPVIRMIVKATMVVIDTRKVCGYFKTLEEAMVWLKGK